MSLPLVLVPLLLALPGLPLDCLPDCTIQGSGVGGFVAPVVVVKSGASVTWTALDGVSHANFEGFVTGDPDASCFFAPFDVNHSGSAQLRLEGGQLVAEQDGVSKVCASASPLPGGAVALGYRCLIHALTMKGYLVVVPA